MSQTESKVGCVFRMVFWSESRLGQYRHDHHKKNVLREKLADERNQIRREEKQKLFESILKMLNDLYLLFLSIKNSNDEALKVVAYVK